jgi:hypothetical protein
VNRAEPARNNEVGLFFSLPSSMGAGGLLERFLSRVAVRIIVCNLREGFDYRDEIERVTDGVARPRAARGQPWWG